MTTAATAAATICRFSELDMCADPVREKNGNGKGGAPKYCANPEHTPLKFARALRKRDGRTGVQVKAERQVDAARPATAARDHAGSLVDRFAEQAGELVTTVLDAIEAMGEAADPDEVRAELDNAQRVVERTKLDAEQRIAEYQKATDEMARKMRKQAQYMEDAETARDEAIGELEALETTNKELTAQVEQLTQQVTNERAEHADQLRNAADAANREIEEVRADATKQVAAADKRAADADTERQRMQQVADQARGEQERLRGELADTRRTQRDDIAELRKEYQGRIDAQRQQFERDLEAQRKVYEGAMDRLQGIGSRSQPAPAAAAAKRAPKAPQTPAPAQGAATVPAPPEGWRPAPYAAGLSPKASIMVWWRGEWRTASIIRRRMKRVQVSIEGVEQYKDVDTARMAVPANTGFDGYQPADS